MRLAAAEAFRSLRTSLSLLGKVEQRKVTLFTSAAPSEGKSFCAINHAISLAQQGLRTLLIDADLRRPSVATLLLEKATSLGLSDLLAGQVALDGVFMPRGRGASFRPARRQPHPEPRGAFGAI